MIILIPLLVLAVLSTLLSLVYIVDMFYNIKRTKLRIEKRHRKYAVSMVIFAIFLCFFNLGVGYYTSSVIWFFGFFLWLLNAIQTNKRVIKLKENEKQTV